MNTDQFVDTHKITMRAKQIEERPDWTSEHDPWDIDATHWRCTFSRVDEDGRRRRATFYFSQGLAFGGFPNAGLVFEAIMDDAASIEGAQLNGKAHFETWANNCGLNEDSRAAERTFKNCQKTAHKLRRFLGNDLYRLVVGRA